MGKRVSIAVCLTLGVSFALGVGCSSIPDSRKTLPAGYDGGGADSGSSGGLERLLRRCSWRLRVGEQNGVLQTTPHDAPDQLPHAIP